MVHVRIAIGKSANSHVSVKRKKKLVRVSIVCTLGFAMIANQRTSRFVLLANQLTAPENVKSPGPGVVFLSKRIKRNPRNIRCRSSQAAYYYHYPLSSLALQGGTPPEILKTSIFWFVRRKVPKGVLVLCIVPKYKPVLLQQFPRPKPRTNPKSHLLVKTRPLKNTRNDK